MIISSLGRRIAAVSAALVLVLLGSCSQGFCDDGKSADADQTTTVQDDYRIFEYDLPDWKKYADADEKEYSPSVRALIDKLPSVDEFKEIGLAEYETARETVSAADPKSDKYSFTIERWLRDELNLSEDQPAWPLHKDTLDRITFIVATFFNNEQISDYLDRYEDALNNLPDKVAWKNDLKKEFEQFKFVWNLEYYTFTLYVFGWTAVRHFQDDPSGALFLIMATPLLGADLFNEKYEVIRRAPYSRFTRQFFLLFREMEKASKNPDVIEWRRKNKDKFVSGRMTVEDMFSMLTRVLQKYDSNLEKRITDPISPQAIPLSDLEKRITDPERSQAFSLSVTGSLNPMNPDLVIQAQGQLKARKSTKRPSIPMTTTKDDYRIFEYDLPDWKKYANADKKEYLPSVRALIDKLPSMEEIGGLIFASRNDVHEIMSALDPKSDKYSPAFEHWFRDEMRFSEDQAVWPAPQKEGHLASVAIPFFIKFSQVADYLDRYENALNNLPDEVTWKKDVKKELEQFIFVWKLETYTFRLYLYGGSEGDLSEVSSFQDNPSISKLSSLAVTFLGAAVIVDNEYDVVHQLPRSRFTRLFFIQLREMKKMTENPRVIEWKKRNKDEFVSDSLTVEDVFSRFTEILQKYDIRVKGKYNGSDQSASDSVDFDGVFDSGESGSKDSSQEPDKSGIDGNAADDELSQDETDGAEVKENAAVPEAGERMEIEISGVKTAFRWAPSGSFVRHWNRKTEGDWGEPTAWSGDKKDFVITLTRGFWLAETETTQELWQAVAGKNLSDGEQTKTTPVNNISWEETQEFVSKLNDGGYAPDGFEFQLPTEAQWEYACMAGAGDERYGELDAIAWYLDNSDGHAHEVGQKGANAWGLYDMLGNVWEWCYDLNEDYPMGNLTDYAGPRMGLDHVCRGGSWSLDAAGVSSSRRSHSRVGYRGLGFRLALVRKER